MSNGLLHSTFKAGLAADRPTDFPGDYDIAIYFATDSGALHVARRPDSGTTATWSPAVMYADFPTEDQEDSVTVWNDEGTLKTSTSGS